MITIRKNTFETNSSSCHSITFATGKPTNLPKDFVLSYDGEFGWSGSCYLPMDKASYYMIAMILWIEDDNRFPSFEEKVEEITKRTNNLIEYARSVGVNMVLDGEMEFDEDGYDIVKDMGYIDHQSAPSEDIDCMGLAKMDAEDAFNWIFNGSACVDIDNDNH